MSRTTHRVLMWAAWIVLFVGLPVFWFMAFAAALDGHPYSYRAINSGLGGFACEGVAALILLGGWFERDGKFEGIRLDWLVPVFGTLGAIGTCVIGVTLARTGDALKVPGVAWYMMGFGLPLAALLSGAWFTRYKLARAL